MEGGRGEGKKVIVLHTHKHTHHNTQLDPPCLCVCDRVVVCLYVLVCVCVCVEPLCAPGCWISTCVEGGGRGWGGGGEAERRCWRDPNPPTLNRPSLSPHLPPPPPARRQSPVGRGLVRSSHQAADPASRSSKPTSGRTDHFSQIISTLLVITNLLTVFFARV